MWRAAATAAVSAEGVTIVPLTSENLSRAIAAAKDGFRYGWPVLNPAKDLRASLAPVHSTARPAMDPTQAEMNARYWVAVDSRGHVVGTTGLYETESDRGHAYWLGWMSVPRAYRGQRISTRLLTFSVEQARKEGREYLRLYTSTSRGERIAQILYEQHGFGIVSRKPHGLPRVLQLLNGETRPLEILFRERRIEL